METSSRSNSGIGTRNAMSSGWLLKNLEQMLPKAQIKGGIEPGIQYTVYSILISYNVFIALSIHFCDIQ